MLLLINTNIEIPACRKESGIVKEVMHLACSLCFFVSGESLTGTCLPEER